jgi:hypothetical protein
MTKRLVSIAIAAAAAVTLALPAAPADAHCLVVYRTYQLVCD